MTSSSIALSAVLCTSESVHKNVPSLWQPQFSLLGRLKFVCVWMHEHVDVLYVCVSCIKSKSCTETTSQSGTLHPRILMWIKLEDGRMRRAQMLLIGKKVSAAFCCLSQTVHNMSRFRCSSCLSHLSVCNTELLFQENSSVDALWMHLGTLCPCFPYSLFFFCWKI